MGSRQFITLLFLISATARGHGPSTAPDFTPPAPEASLSPSPTVPSESELSIQRAVETSIGSPTGEAQLSQALQMMFPAATEEQARAAARMLRNGYTQATQPLRAEAATANSRVAALTGERDQARRERDEARRQLPFTGPDQNQWFRAAGNVPPQNRSSWGFVAGQGWYLMPAGTPAGPGTGVSQWTFNGTNRRWEFVDGDATGRLTAAPQTPGTMLINGTPSYYDTRRNEFVPVGGGPRVAPAPEPSATFVSGGGPRPRPRFRPRILARRRLFQSLSN